MRSLAGSLADYVLGDAILIPPCPPLPPTNNYKMIQNDPLPRDLRLHTEIIAGSYKYSLLTLPATTPQPLEYLRQP